MFSFHVCFVCLGSNKATRVFSSSKYPSAEKEPDYQSVFAEVPENIGHPDLANYTIRTKHQLPDEKVSAMKGSLILINER